ncbi:uncharacterized protein LOC135368467 isoform X2 [Ornithodoros turicata]|uniref:uncharacterized protein LOC135368467 isoform X2 n=1 Tax=Ornithodoros turicata TaxID=34597 RepID=UPI003138801B
MDLRPSDRPPERPSFLALPESTCSSRDNDDVFLTDSPVDDSGPYEECSSSERPRRLSSSRSLPCVQERRHDKAERSDSAPSPMQLTGSSCDTPMTDSFPASTPSREDDDDQSRSAYEGILQCERDFFDFVMTLPSEPKPTKPSPTRVRRESKTKPKPKVGLDHLDNLCKLMEQLGDLKEQNSKLHRRVQYLEDVKNLHEMHKDILSRRPASMSSRQSEAYDESVYQDRYETQLQDRTFENPLQKSKTQISMGSLQRKTRERSRSVGNQDEFNDPKGSLKSKKFPNWSKVKEALGFEQRPSDYDVDGNSFREGNRILGPDVVHHISVPIYSDEYDRNFDGRVTNVGERCRQKEPWTDWTGEGRLQSKGYPNERSDDAICERRTHLRPQQPVRRRSSPGGPSVDKDRFSDHSKKEQYSLTLHPNVYPTYARSDLKDDPKKAPKTPWGRVKTLIQTKRGSVKKRQSTKSDGKEFRMNSDPSCNAAFSDYEEGVSRRTRDIRHRRRKVSDQYADGGSSRHSGVSDDFCGFPKERSKSQTHIERDYYRDFESSEDSRPRKQKPAPLTLSPLEHASSSAGHSRTSSGVTSETCQRLSPRSSPQFQRKSRWNKVKKVFTAKAKDGDASTTPTTQYPFSKSVPASPLSLVGTVFNYDDLGPYEDEDITKTREASVDRQRVDSLPLSLCPSSDGELSLFPLSQSASTPMSSLVLQLQRNLSEDFSQKMLEWERIKASGVASTATTKDRAKSKSEKLKGERQSKPAKPKLKDLTWLNKELHKIEREKERLAKEKRKYEERSARLQRLKHTLLSSGENRNEILVRTSAGEFRFEGISDAFTKKLYEWETKKGVVPELSTIALLDASLSGEKGVGLPRGLSRSDSSIADQASTHHQASHGSTSSLPSMKPDSGFSQEENVQPSRANSEPDLSTPHGQARRDSCLSRRRHSQDQKWPAGEYGAYVNPEVTWLIDSGSGELALEEDDRRLTKSPENQDYDEADVKATEDGYYVLLEENMLLLEQLKAKEDLCRQMERELQLLDARLGDVSDRHRQEIDRYRERLWEAHRPALLQFGFRESQASLKVLTELKSRVDDLERFGRRFYDERRTLQDHMRYQSEDQLRLSRDVVASIRDLHCPGAPDALQGLEGPERRSSSVSSWNWQRFVHVEKLALVQDLLGKLLRLAQEIEMCAAERAHQLWVLRGEILQRDLVSARNLHADIYPFQRVASTRAPWGRCRSMPKRSFSDGIIQHLRNSREDTDNPLAINDNLSRKSRTDFSEWQLNTSAAQLLETVQQLETELLGLLCDVMNTEANEQQECIGEQEQPALESGDVSSETRTDDGTGGEARSSLASSESPIRPSESVSANATVRHNSADNVSSVSGHDGSESSSLNDSERVSFVLRLPRKSWTRTRETVSSSSDSSYLEDETFTRAAWSSGKNRLEAAERKQDATEAFNSPIRLRDEVFEEPSSASSVEAVFSLPYPCHVYSGTGKFNAVLAEETADMLRDAEGTSRFGCNETAEATVTLCQPRVAEVPIERNASYVNDGDSSNSEGPPEVSEIGKMAARGESPVLRSKSTRKLKKAKETIGVSRTEEQPQSFPSVSSTASSPPLSPAKIISDEELTTSKQESAKHDAYHSVLTRGPSTGYVPSPVHSTSSTSPASLLSPVPSYSHIPHQGALSRFEALHRAKTEFFAKEGPVVISTDVLTSRSLQASTTFPQKGFNVEIMSKVAEPSDAGHADLPQCGASVPRVPKEETVPSPTVKATAEEPTRKKSRQECGQADKTSFLSLKLKKSKKKDYSTVEELCRQTLTVTVAEREVADSGSEPVSPVSPISPPSPSEPRTKGINKWLPIFSTKP